MNGFIFHFENISDITGKKKIYIIYFFFNFFLLKEDHRNSVLVQLKMKDPKNGNKFEKVSNKNMKIKIKSNDDPHRLFQLIHKAILEFVSKWFIKKFSNEIYYKITKKSLQRDGFIISNFFIYF